MNKKKKIDIRLSLKPPIVNPSGGSFLHNFKSSSSLNLLYFFIRLFLCSFQYVLFLDVRGFWGTCLCHYWFLVKSTQIGLWELIVSHCLPVGRLLEETIHDFGSRGWSSHRSIQLTFIDFGSIASLQRSLNISFLSSRVNRFRSGWSAHITIFGKSAFDVLSCLYFAVRWCIERCSISIVSDLLSNTKRGNWMIISSTLWERRNWLIVGCILFISIRTIREPMHFPFIHNCLYNPLSLQWPLPEFLSSFIDFSKGIHRSWRIQCRSLEFALSFRGEIFVQRNFRWLSGVQGGLGQGGGLLRIVIEIGDSFWKILILCPFIRATKFRT